MIHGGRRGESAERGNVLAATYGRSIFSIELPAAPAVTVIDAHFDVDADGFTYADDAFRATAQPAYASGARIATGGFSGGALQVSLGGIDDASIQNMSGGWSRSCSRRGTASGAWPAIRGSSVTGRGPPTSRSR